MNIMALHLNAGSSGRVNIVPRRLHDHCNRVDSTASSGDSVVMDDSDHATLIATLPLFKGLSPNEISNVAELFHRVAAGPGQVIFGEGDTSLAMYVLESGCAEVRKRTAQGDSQVLATLNAPSVFGEVGLVDGAPRSASVVAATHISLLRVNFSDFAALKAAWNPAAYKIIRNIAITMCERLRDTTARINDFFADPETSLRQMQERQQQLWRARESGRKEI